MAGSELWEARALTAAVINGERNVAAGLLLSNAFRLIDSGDHAASRAVLLEQLRLLDNGPTTRPNVDVVRRMHYEKLGYSYLIEGDFEDAERLYEQALQYSPSASRGSLKVRGAVFLCPLSRCGWEAVGRTQRLHERHRNRGQVGTLP